MRYLSVCSGIEAATVAWHPLGFEPVAFSEIEPFPCKVLARHYPTIPNLGNMTQFKEWQDYADVDILVGGTPCQSFSIAGLRKGLDDPRGNLMLTYLAIAAKYNPRWIVWENVPGVLSSNGGKDFGTFLGGLGELGYGFTYRVLDAQYCRTDGHPYAVPQRRRRVFVVGCLGSWQRAAAVLFDSESLSRNTPPSRKAREGTAGAVSNRIESGVSKCLTRGTSQRYDSETETMITTYALAGNTIGRQPENGGNGTGFDADGAGYTLTNTDVHAVAFSGCGATLKGGSGARGYPDPSDGNGHNIVGNATQVRRLTPLECERLQGFPDNYTNIPGASDSARYKALGNSMAVNVMQLIGQRIQMVHNITKG